MTKVREPLSIGDDLLMVLGDLKIENVAELTGHSVGYLRNLTNTDKREIQSVRDMELLDLASEAKNSKGFPLFEALGRRPKSAIGRPFRWCHLHRPPRRRSRPRTWRGVLRDA